MMISQRFKDYLRYIWSNKNYRLSFYLGAATLAWLTTGLLGGDPESKEVTVQAEAKKARVQAQYFDAQDYQPSIRVRARTQANRSVSLRSELSGKVVGLPAREGQPVKQGDVVCELALDDRKLRLLEAKSAVEQAQLEYDGSLRLKSGGYQSATAIAGAKARLDSAKAGLLRSELDLANVKIRAPFDGVVDRHAVEIGDFMDRGDECGVVLDLHPIIVRGRVSETEVVQLTSGTEASGVLLTGQQVQGKVSLVGYASDEVTRTFPVEVSVANADLALRSGITTDLVIPVDVLRAHVISPSLLSLDDAGELGLRILNEDHQVAFTHVKLIGDHDDGVWITGLPERALVVTVGQEYVSDGQLVEAVITPDAIETTAVASAVEVSTEEPAGEETSAAVETGSQEALETAPAMDVSAKVETADL